MHLAVHSVYKKITNSQGRSDKCLKCTRLNNVGEKAGAVTL